MNQERKKYRITVKKVSCEAAASLIENLSGTDVSISTTPKRKNKCNVILSFKKNTND